MTKHFKPDSYNSLSPYFIVDDTQSFIDFLLKVLNGEELRRFEDSDGRIVHAEIRIDDSILMMSNSNEKYPQFRQVVHLYVPDVDSVFESAIQAGCEIIHKPVEQQGDPDKRGTFIDIAGNIWSIGTQK